MVFTVAEDANHSNQVIGMLPKGKQSRQRKNSGPSRKGKSGSAKLQLNSKNKKTFETPISPENISMLQPMVSLTQRNMGSVQSRIGNRCMDVSIEPSSNAVEAKNEVNSVHHMKQAEKNVPLVGNVTNMADGNEKDKEKEKATCSHTGSNSNSPEEKAKSTSTSEVANLKKLLLLQASLISRQKDLLRMREQEILQLKASNQNIQCQLTRVRRRVSSKRGSPMYEKLTPERSVKNPDPNFVIGAGNVDSACSSTDTLPVKRRCSNSKGVVASENTDIKIDYKANKITSEGKLDNIDTPMKLESQGTKSSVPVPLSFIERRQNELISALITSPPDKALKNFCTIVDSPSPPGGSDTNLASFPFKICNRCPHCVAIAAEIARLIKIAEHSKFSESSSGNVGRNDKLQMLKLSYVDPISNEVETKNSHETKEDHIMRTTLSYFHHSPTFDADHWWWDLKCGNIAGESKLNIPTWKEKSLSDIPLTPANPNEVYENTDDTSFAKRHSKHELDEKRRKRWDIQRIREYRQNEKLRQKLLKQAAVYDAPVIDSFAGHLHDAESIEVHENLPVNIFGYPAPHCDPEEFTLTPMYQIPKTFMSGNSKRKSKSFL